MSVLSDEAEGILQRCRAEEMRMRAEGLDPKQEPAPMALVTQLAHLAYMMTRDVPRRLLAMDFL